MSIETLDDIATELANALGIYGVCDGNTIPCNCRCCWESGFKTRVRDAVELDRILEAAAAGRRERNE